MLILDIFMYIALNEVLAYEAKIGPRGQQQECDFKLL